MIYLMRLMTTTACKNVQECGVLNFNIQLFQGEYLFVDNCYLAELHRCVNESDSWDKNIGNHSSLDLHSLFQKEKYLVCS